MAAIWAGVAGAALSGCGTIHNFMGDDAADGPCAVFGGVRSDVCTGCALLHDPTDGRGDATVRECAKLSGLYMLSVDLPFSAVGDTLTLPMAVLCQLQGRDVPRDPPQKHQRPRSSQAAEPAEPSSPAAEEDDSP
jgi:uncharacterized protein YceK